MTAENPKSLRSRAPALICVDIQRGFEDEAYWGGNRNNRNAEVVCGVIIEKWRELGLDIFHIRHSSTNPESRLHASHPGFAFHLLALPHEGEPVLTKSVNSGFIGTNLQAMLDERGRDVVVIIGLTTDHCVSTTTRMAGNLGYETLLVSDAVATFDKTGVDGEHFSAEMIHATALASLNEEFARVLTSGELFASLQG